ESTATLYILSIKSGYYNRYGQITELLADAKLFSSQQEAIDFRKLYDPQHYVDCSVILQLTVFVSQID
ncbi:MAG TPA: hypothetical protein VFK47_15960, partial [Ktedonobacteraceae bacterium]|nr:hypothetical protein [Ktedonobacteraceae bacterium]